MIAALGVLLMVAGNYLPVLPPSSLAGILAASVIATAYSWWVARRIGA